MKVLKIILTVFFVLIVLAVLGLMIFIRTFDLNKYKPLITQKVSEALSRPVEIRRLDFAFSADKGIAVAVHGVNIQDDPAFASGTFVAVENIKLSVDVMKYVSQKEIVVTGITVAAPTIQIVRNKAGVMNVQTVGPKSAVPTTGGTVPSKPASSTPPAATSTPAIPPFLVKNIQINDAEIVFVDQMVSPAMKLKVDKVNFQIENFSLNEPFTFALACSVFSAEQNIQLKGQTLIEPNKLAVKLQNVRFNTDLSQIVLELVQKAVPTMKELSDVRSLQGKINVNITELSANVLGLMQMNATGELTGGKVDYRVLPQPIEDIYVNFDANKKDLNISKMSARYGTGAITANARIADYLKEQRYTLALNVDNLDIKQPIPDLGAEARFTGLVKAKSNVSGAGFDPNVLISNLVGEGSMSVDKAKLENVNLLRLILSKLSMIPNLQEKIEQNLPEKYKEQLNRTDTLFQTVEFAFKADKGLVNINKAALIADVVAVNAQGTLDAKQNLSLNTLVSIPQDLSESMVKSVPELQMLIAASGQIEIPMQPYSGPASKVKIFPDLEYLGKRIIANQGAQQIQKLLDKALGREEEQAPADGTGETPAQTEKQKRPEQQLIQDILGNILK